uniref:Uncharacterized protein n=1 Tax=Micrurus carvalhoi TaxID=3147026 RepID=A0A2H6ND10_9SAUR
MQFPIVNRLSFFNQVTLDLLDLLYEDLLVILKDNKDTLLGKSESCGLGQVTHKPSNKKVCSPHKETRASVKYVLPHTGDLTRDLLGSCTFLLSSNIKCFFFHCYKCML